jgi:hypothetical protein
MLDVKAKGAVDSGRDAHGARARHRDRPSMTIVSIATDDSVATLRSIGERSAHWERLGVERVIVCRRRPNGGPSFGAMSGGARLIYGPSEATERQLRGIGLLAATGDVVMLVDDPATADVHWIEHLRAISAFRPTDTGDGPPASR